MAGLLGYGHDTTPGTSTTEGQTPWQGGFLALKELLVRGRSSLADPSPCGTFVPYGEDAADSG